MNEILDTAGKFRVRLEVDQTAENPRTGQDNLCHVITVPGGRYINVDKHGGPLEGGWYHFKDRSDAVEIFMRWARIFHGAVIDYHTPHEGANSIWYLVPEQFSEVSDSAACIKAEIQEYQNWCDGEVYGYIIEKSVTWTPKDEEDSENLGEMVTWETAEDCWGYIGYEYAKKSAEEAFESYKAEAEAA